MDVSTNPTLGLILISFAVIAKPAPLQSQSVVYWNEPFRLTIITALDTATMAEHLAEYLRDSFPECLEPMITESCLLTAEGRFRSEMTNITQYSEGLAFGHQSVQFYLKYMRFVIQEEHDVSRNAYFQDLHQNMHQISLRIRFLLCLLVDEGFLQMDDTKFCSVSINHDMVDMRVDKTQRVKTVENGDDGDGAGDGPDYCWKTQYGYQYQKYRQIFSLMNNITSDILGIEYHLAH